MGWDRGFSRRSALLGVVGGGGVALLGRSVSAQGTTTGVTEGDCSQLPGLQLMMDWFAGKPVVTHEELVPPPTWRLFSQTGAPVSFLYPGDWTATAMWASGLTRPGAIAWQGVPSASSYLSAVRIVSPDQRAMYEYVTGGLVGVSLDLEQAAAAAEQGALGDGQTTELICFSRNASTLGESWTRAGWFGEYAVVTGGNLASLAGSYPAFSTLGYQTFVGPEDQFTELVRGVFIPIMFQFMLSAPGSGGDEDDDDDDDDGDDDDS